jgi:DNA polymerase III gamma/tau subunit
MIPTKPEHFAGKAGIIARVLFHKIPQFQKEKLPALDRRYLLTGEAGTGKTSLAMAFAAALTGNSVQDILNRTATNVDWYNGQSATVEVIRKWREQGCYLPMYGSRVVQIVDEIDAISIAAANEALSYLDSLPHHTVFFATTNKEVKDLPDRLQSRFKVHRFSKVDEATIISWLAAQFPALSPDQHQSIAESAGGNIRAAITDALSIIETQEALA